MFETRFRNRHRRVILLVLALFSAASCSGEERPVKGFVLPPGDIERGEQVFLAFNCHHCHTIPGKDFPDPENEAAFILEIGGEVLRVKNYGELLTAVVNPDHVLSPRYRRLLREAGREPDLSPMPNFSGQMTVAQLIDVAEFLHAQYSKLQPDYYHGPYMPK